VIFSLGSHGDDVRRIETRLATLKLYTGAMDGSYGGGVESAVKAFQRSHGLAADGVVGDDTWKALFADEPPPVNQLAAAPLIQRCLALTGAFETSMGVPDCFAGLAGDFDGQGLSFGVVQWNLGQGTLQPLLNEMFNQHEAIARELFHDHFAELQGMLASPRDLQLRWSRKLQDPNRHTLFEPWKGLLQALGRTPEFQAIQVDHAAALHAAAQNLCSRFELASERAVALMFDIRVQNGSIDQQTEARIRQDFAALAPGDEVGRLRSIANRRAEAAAAQFIEDVRIRKLTIANGAGTVHGITWDLEAQFGIGLHTAD
jgi:hypothetical protein